MKESDVFLSYRRKDVDFVKPVVEALQAAGREVWVDWEDIPPGVEGFADEIQSGIESANAFVAILSPAYLESEYCLMELREALRLKKRIVPVVYQKFEPAPPPEGIGHINWVYFTPHAGQENTFEQSFPKVIQALEADYEHAREHTRLLMRAIDWDKNQRNPSYLLKGAEIDKAETWQVKAAGKDPAPTELQIGYTFDSRKEQRRQQQRTLAVIGALLVVAVIAAVVAVFQANAARISAANARSEALAAAALQPGNEDLAVALVLAATRNDHASPEIFKTLELVAYPSGGIRYLHHPAPEDDFSQFVAPAVSPDGQFAMVKNRLYDLTTDKLVRKFAGTPGYVLSGLFTPDGARVILAGDDDGVLDPNAHPVFLGLYDVATGGLLQKFDTQTGVDHIALSADGKTLISYQADAKIVWWQVGDGKKLREFDWDGFSPVTFSPDLKWMAVVQNAADGSNRELAILDTGTGQSRTILTAAMYSWSQAFSPDSKEIAVNADDLAVYNVETGERLTLFPKSSRDILSLRYSPDGTGLLTMNGDKTISLWNRATGELLTRQTAHRNQLLFADYVHGGERVASMDADGVILVWDVLPGNLERRLPANVSISGLTGDGRELVVQTYSDSAALILDLDARTLQEKTRLTVAGVFPKMHGSAQKVVLLSFYLAQGLEKGLFLSETYTLDANGVPTNYAVNLVSLKDGKVLRQWKNDAIEHVLSGLFSPDGQKLWINFRDKNSLTHLEEWDLAIGSVTRQFFSPPLAGDVVFALSSDGSRLLYAAAPRNPAGDGNLPATLKMIDTASGATLFSLENQNLSTLFFTPAGTQFIVADGDFGNGTNGRLSIRDAKTGSLVRELALKIPPQTSFQLSPDGRSLYTSSGPVFGGGMTGETPSGLYFTRSNQFNGSLRQWDFLTGALLREFPVQPYGLGLSPDGTRMYTDAGDLRSWRLDTPAQLVAWACANRYVPEFTPDQRQRFGIENAAGLCLTE